MKVYLQIIKCTISEYMAYRLSFVLWRVRMIVQLLVAYFLWLTITSQHTQVFGYTQVNILTYILMTLIVRPMVMGTRTHEVGNMILSGKLNYLLLEPMNLLKFFGCRDVADKLINVIFAIGEFAFLIWILRLPWPPVVIWANVWLMLPAIILGIIMFFFFSLIFSYLAFWTDEVWAPRFLTFVFAEFFTGMLFPLDILPGALGIISKMLPFGYFIYFPVRIMLGGLEPGAIVQGFMMAIIWAIGLGWMARLLWNKGLKTYTAVGI